MRQMVEKAEAKRAWFGQFKEWVEGVAGFLDEKVIISCALIVEPFLIMCSILYSKSWKRSMFLSYTNDST